MSEDFINSDGSIDIAGLAMHMITETEQTVTEEQLKLDEQKKLLDELDEFEWGIRD
tara:strand:- start:92 stop:259 length:168 start_codon:yes stop_codon:yes gene_type:complete